MRWLRGIFILVSLVRYLRSGALSLERTPNGLVGFLEKILDINQLSKGLDFYQISGISPSPNNEVIAYGEDKNGRREYTIKFKNLQNEKLITDKLKNASGSFTPFSS